MMRRACVQRPSRRFRFRPARATAAAAVAAAAVAVVSSASALLRVSPQTALGLGSSPCSAATAGVANCRGSRIAVSAGQGFGAGVKKAKRPAEKVPDGPPKDYDTGPCELFILKYPHPALRRPNGEVTEFDDRLRHLARNLFDAMYRETDPPGIGLAAPQVGVNKRVLVYNALREEDAENRHGEEVFVNPRIVTRSDELAEMTESCLSFPKAEGPVRRPAWIEIEAFDLDGKSFRRRIDDIEATVFQHEYDHLDGVLYIDHLAKSDRVIVQPQLDRLVRAYEAGGGKEKAI